MSVWTDERKEIATWLSGYLNMVKTWVDKILDNEHYDVDKIKIIGLIDEWIAWLEDTKLKIMKMKDIDPNASKEELALLLTNAEGKKKQIYFENPDIQSTNAIQDELEHFAKCIENKTTPLVSLEDGKKALEVAYQIIERIERI